MLHYENFQSRVVIESCHIFLSLFEGELPQKTLREIVRNEKSIESDKRFLCIYR